ncbi:hypothetical protein I6N95_10450 [Vagococcus sp. BWB3-3]|uniref:Uncharacterized protein n=1 Tax=Vagococcus allomyrinae TaxID=2794353 RepID=A0A940PB02_9ENTE|nr:hypothetical protein [Vagococcus allomyrinae]MBP1041425.1 hypothetical protein [Vagococcus allomyrinae]
MFICRRGTSLKAQQKRVDLKTTQKWVYRNARPLDLLRWQTHFEKGPEMAAAQVLAAFQNKDGGFAFAMEPDSWNQCSSPIQTWAAVEVLRELELLTVESHLVRTALTYLEHSFDHQTNCWPTTIKAQENCPQAFWWEWSKELNLNPTAYFCGLIIRFAEKGSSLYKLAIDLANQSIAHFLNSKPTTDGHLLLCYLRLLEFSEEAGYTAISKQANFHLKLQAEIKGFMTQLDMDWLVDGVAYGFLQKYQDDLSQISDNPNIVSDIVEYLMTSIQDNGTWTIPWAWNDFPDEWAISQNWWRSHGIISTLLFLRKFGYLVDE